MDNAVEVVVVLLLVLIAIGLCTLAIARAVQIVDDSRSELPEDAHQPPGGDR